MPFRFTGKIDKLTFKLGPSQIKESDKPAVDEGHEEVRQLSDANCLSGGPAACGHLSGGDPAHRRDRVGNRQRPARHVGVQEFDHPAVELDAPLPAFSGSANAAMMAAALSTSAEVGANDLVADVDLARVDQGLAVEAHVAALLAFIAEAVEILDVVEDAVDDVDAMGARGDHAARSRRSWSDGRGSASRGSPWRGR